MNSKPMMLGWLVVALALAVLPTTTAAEIRLLPPSARLIGPSARQRFLVERIDGTVGTSDLTATATFAIDNPAVATIDRTGALTPLSNGLVTISATVEGQVARASISVENQGDEASWNFRNHVQPILTRLGCNSGACHGAAAGKNGFRLSLRGYAPETDFAVLTRQELGRRVDKTAPEQSLLVLKPTGAIEHGGGVRFGADSLEYQVITGWIAGGMPGPSASDPVIRSLSVYPTACRLEPGQFQQILVQANYSDGRVEDVTRWAKFHGTDDSVATVDDSGRVKVVGRGEASVSVWFSSLIGRVLVTSPYDTELDPGVFAAAARRNPIDDHNLEKLAALRIPPSPDCGDAIFLRRAYLDATGTLPAAEAAAAFLKNQAADKRAVLIEQLVGSPEFVDYWAYKWSDLLLVSSRKLSAPAMWSFYRFVRESVARNVPWDQFARAIVTARGTALANGAVNFYALHRDPIDLAESVSVAFLGLSLTCARCHNHPLEKWTQDQYYSFANLFARIALKDGETPGDDELTTAGQGEILHPRRGVAMPPLPLDETRTDETRDRRAVLADWLSRADNPYFATAIVNRVWANFFGRGLVDPEDDLRASNPASDPALLDWLVADFRAYHYDVKHLIRSIMSSAVYARSSLPVAGNQFDQKYLSHYRVKRLPAEVLLDAIARVTEVPTSFTGYPAGWRSLQLPDTKVDNAFLESFGRPARAATCSCERSAEPSMAQALHMANGSTINDKLSSDQGVTARSIARNESDEAILDRLFLSALARHSTPAERERMLKLMKDAVATSASADVKVIAVSRRQAADDLYWAVLTSPEFLFNH